MKQSQMVKGLLLLLALAAGAGALLWGHGVGSARRTDAQQQSAANTGAPPQQLSADAQASLRAIVQSGNLPELRWPDFSDYGSTVQEFYDSYGYSLPWVRGMEPTAQARQVIALLQKAEQKGLSPDDYDGPRWDERLAKLKPSAGQPSEADAVQFDAALTVCVMRYISDLHIGKVNPKHFDFGFDVAAKKYDLPQFVKEDVVDVSDVGAALAQVEPPYPGYQRTIAALQTYLVLAKQQDGKQLPAIQKTVSPGDSYAGVPQLIVFLRLVGDLPADASVPADTTVYQGPLVDAVKSFQNRHGRTPDGRIGAQTLADMNVPLSHRVQPDATDSGTLALAADRVCIRADRREYPGFRLRAYDENFSIGLAMNVVVGKAYDHGTPVFEDNMQYVVFRPYWNVPYSIANRNFFRRFARDPGLSGEERIRSGGQPPAAQSLREPCTSDVLAQLRAGKLFIRQMPGPKNSLGLVKFIFPNDYNVYMHDTPDAGILLEDPAGFQPRLHPAGKARRLGGVGAAQQSRMERGESSRGHEWNHATASESGASGSGANRLCHGGRTRRMARFTFTTTSTGTTPRSRKSSIKVIRIRASRS